MKIFVLTLILAALLQASFLPINLVLLLIVSRSIIRPASSNLVLAFMGGILLGLLNNINLGFYALVMLLIAELLFLFANSRFSSNLLLVIPISFIALLVLAIFEKIFLGSSFNLTPIIIQSLISLPVYILVRFWEERFIPVPEIKLKIR